jgi:hypothetical protein
MFPWRSRRTAHCGMTASVVSIAATVRSRSGGAITATAASTARSMLHVGRVLFLSPAESVVLLSAAERRKLRKGCTTRPKDGVWQ